LSQQAWQHKLNTAKCAIYFTALFIESIAQKKQNGYVASTSRTQLSSEHAFKQWGAPDVKNQMGKVSQKEPLSTKNAASSQNNEVYFMEFFVEYTCKKLRAQFHNRNELSISHTRSSALKMRSNNMEHPLLNNQMGNRSHNMGFGTCLNKKWWLQLKTATLAIFSQSKDAGAPSYDTAMGHLFLYFTNTMQL
jgi:hypothetical protein